MAFNCASVQMTLHSTCRSLSPSAINCSHCAMACGTGVGPNSAKFDKIAADARDQAVVPGQPCVRHRTLSRIACRGSY